MTSPNADPVLLVDDLTDQDSAIGRCIFNPKYIQFDWNYRRENGRTYHSYKDGKYYLPNDEDENDRLDLQHNLYILTFDNKLGLSPPNKSDFKTKRVLDLGTGTGIWAIDYADEHPDAEIIGIDLSPIQPAFVPQNVRFIIDDVEEPWHYAEAFDYIHGRAMNASIQNWKEYLQNIFDNLTPGGYVELQEHNALIDCDDGTLTQDHKLSQWSKLLHEASAKLGRAFATFEGIKGLMHEIGFTDIVDARFKWPTNRWPKDPKFKELGTWSCVNSLAVLESTTAAFTRGHDWSPEELELFLVDVRKDVKNPALHSYWPTYCIYGRRPEA